MYNNLRIHFVGIGGIGMSGIAEVLLNQGYSVSGSDIKSSSIIFRLKNLGVTFFEGHAPQNVEGTDVVVFSSAVKPDNPEILRAQELNLTIIPRAQMLAELMRLKKYGIAIAGSHGKTTTTSILATILCDAGLDPTAIIGGKLNAWGSNAKLGSGDFMVVEADESDGSFVRLLPTIAVVTNIDPEHLDHYGNFESVLEAFKKFCERVPFYGLVICCGDHLSTRALSSQLERRVQTYGFEKQNDWRAINLENQNSRVSFDVEFQGKLLGAVSLNVPGKHNVLNALSTIAVATEIGIDFETIKFSLLNFAGVGRRLECLYKSEQTIVYDDYGHHPVEIQATLSAVRQMYPNHFLRVVFQPHRYTRTRDLMLEFARSFECVDELFLLPIYSASEAPIENVSSNVLAQHVLETGKKNVVVFNQNDGSIFDFLNKSKGLPEVVLSLGAGDVTLVGREFAQRLLQEKSSHEKYDRVTA